MLWKNRIVMAAAAVIIVAAGIFVVCRLYYKEPAPQFSQDIQYPQDLQYSQEYVAGSGNIKGNVDTDYFADLSADFEIGANQYGVAVFKNPAAAFAGLVNNYKAGIDLIQKECALEPLSQTNYGIFGTYGWQVTTGTEKEKKQAAFVSGFMDIYENSFIHQ